VDSGGELTPEFWRMPADLSRAEIRFLHKGWLRRQKVQPAIRDQRSRLQRAVEGQADPVGVTVVDIDVPYMSLSIEFYKIQM
jgi:hypothetical protein